MPSAFTQNFYHTVFSTKHRTKLITPDLESKTRRSNELGHANEARDLTPWGFVRPPGGRRKVNDRGGHDFQGFETPGNERAPSGRKLEGIEPGRHKPAAQPDFAGARICSRTPSARVHFRP